MIVALATRMLGRHKWLLIAMAAALSAFQVLLVVIARNMQTGGLFSQMAAFIPGNVQAAFGGPLIASFGGLVAFGFFHPVVVLALAIGAAYLAGELAGDVEEGLVDFIAARPVPRATLVARAALVMLGASATVLALMLTASRVATMIYAPDGTAAPRAAALARVAANALAVTWCCGAVGLALASGARRRATAAGTATILFVSLYLLNFAATVWTPARPFARLAPFHYFDPIPIIIGTHDPTMHIAGLLAATALLVSVAIVIYRQRDL